MKKFLMAIMAMLVLVSCGNRYDKLAALYEDATEKVVAAETIEQITEIDDQLENDVEAVYEEYKEEFAADLIIALSGSDSDEAKALDAESDKVQEAQDAYKEAKRARKQELRD